MKKIIINGHDVQPGKSLRLELPVARLYTDSKVSIPVEVTRAKADGPIVFVSAAVHGDELNGIEIVSRLIQSKSLRIVAGTLILVPIVNVYGVLNHSRYMPDRRDLNRSFPGSSQGSLAGRVAATFIKEIVSHCDYGIDLHTGAIHRSNLPQIRANLKDRETLQLAEKFGVPVLLNSDLRDGSLRQAATESGCKILLYEAGQALRFDELSVRAGVKGIRNCLAHLNMIKPVAQSRARKNSKNIVPFTANTSAWMRAPCSGIVINREALGALVKKDDVLAEIRNPFGDHLGTVNASRDGIIIGKQNIPLVQEGDAMFHIAYFAEDDSEIVENIEKMSDTLLPSSIAE